MTTGMSSPLHCLVDETVLKSIGVSTAALNRTGGKTLFPKYLCPKCNRKYTSVKGYTEGWTLRLDKVEYININREADAYRHNQYFKQPRPVAFGSKCYICENNRPNECRVCHSSDFVNWIIPPADKKKKTNYQVYYCETCGIYYANYVTYRAFQNKWRLLNPGELPKFEDEYRVWKEAKEKRKIENKAIREMAKTAKEDRRRRKLDAQRIEHDNNLRVKDFVVRRTTFKCRHKDHKLQNINATISLINQNGEVKQATIPAGYCPNCNVFFIMESTYQNLILKGTLICRVSDEKAYLSNSTFVNGMQLAQESVLKQYGYSVSQQDDLTSARRRKILALLVDNKILTRSDIISYLDFFISQKKYDNKFGKAIDKWKSDREFISEYKAGQYSTYGIRSIYRK